MAWKLLEQGHGFGYMEYWDPEDWAHQIEIHCKGGKLLPSDHELYSIEASFIQDQIKNYGIYDGEICCI